MTDPFLTGLGGDVGGASSGVTAQEDTAADAVMHTPGVTTGPSWAVVYATVPLGIPGEGVLQRGELATVDIDDPYWQEKLRHGLVAVADEADQPTAEQLAQLEATQ